MKLALEIISTFSLIVLCYSRTFRFAFSNDGWPANYLTESRELVGQSVDMVMRVCKEAGQKCRSALVQRAQCWDNKLGFTPFSPVLNGRWFDSCANLPQSPERSLNYLFPAETFYLTDKMSLLVAENSKISQNDLLQCNDFTVAYPIETALDPNCLLDLGFFVQRKNYKPVSVPGDLRDVMSAIIEMVKNNTVDMGLAITRFQGDSLRGVKPVNERFAKLNCKSEIDEGLSVMMRTDDEDFVSWWDKAVHKFLCSGKKYDDFCKEMKDKYNADPLCRIPGVHVDCSKFGGKSLAKQNPSKVDRINPCLITTCKNDEVSKFKNDFFEIKDNFKSDVPAVRNILRGSDAEYKAPQSSKVVLTITAKDGGFFRVDRICLDVARARFVKYVFRGGNREAEELNIPVDVEASDWSTNCATDKGVRDRIRIEIDPLKSTKGFKAPKILARELDLTVCLDPDDNFTV